MPIGAICEIFEKQSDRVFLNKSHKYMFASFYPILRQGTENLFYRPEKFSSPLLIKPTGRTVTTCPVRTTSDEVDLFKLTTPGDCPFDITTGVWFLEIPAFYLEFLGTGSKYTIAPPGRELQIDPGDKEASKRTRHLTFYVNIFENYFEHIEPCNFELNIGFRIDGQTGVFQLTQTELIRIEARNVGSKRVADFPVSLGGLDFKLTRPI